MLTRPEMEKGVYYLAVFNHNWEPSVDCSYSIRVSLVSNVNLIYGPYIPWCWAPWLPCSCCC